MNILALSGSLRRGSYNTFILRALSCLAPAGVTVSVFEGMGELPLFNPDLEPESLPAVANLKQAVGSVNGLIIASPEYAHGISGVMKNALDWLVSGEEFVGMPVMLVNCSPRAHHAQEALREVVTTMSGIIVGEACFSIPLLGSNLDEQGVLAHAVHQVNLETHLQLFVDAILGPATTEK